MKSPDEIKKGLECCWGSRAETGLVDCGQCPYWGKYGCPAGKVKLGNDALALIQQLEAQNAEQAERIQQLEAERDAAVTDMKNSRDCQYCKHYDVKWDEPCVHCDHENNCFEWRGIQKEE